MLWAIVFGVVALATLATITLPLLRRGYAVADNGQYDRAVYRDQLKEVDRDVARGVLSPTEATSAKLEIQRRLLAAGGRTSKAGVQAGRSPLLAIGIGGFVLIASTALYLQLGAPGLPDAPFASRGANVATVMPGNHHMDMQAAVLKLRAKLASNPNDPNDWLLYARTEGTLGDWAKARDAFKQAIALGQDGPDVLAAYGEMQVLAEQGIVPPAATTIFTQVLKADPTNDVARYYLALAAAQAGEVKKAIGMWASLAADVPENSPMRSQIARNVAAAAQSGGIPVPTLPKGTTAQAAPPTPDAAAAKAVEQMSPAQRKDVIRGMVAQLAAKLQTNPNDLQGWMQLGRSYMVLGDKDKAANAYAHAATLQPDDVTIKVRELTALVSGLNPHDALPVRVVTLLHQVEKAQPDQPEALWYLGVNAAHNGHRTEARAYWTRLLKVLPAGGNDAKLVKEALDTVKGP